MLTTISRDANSSLFLVVVCICEGENFDSWCWFLQLLHDYIGKAKTRTITFISDR